MEHHFWKYLEPQEFSQIELDEMELGLYREVVRNYYVFSDDLLGQFLSAFEDDELTVLVVSDHGHEANPRHDRAAPSGYGRFASGIHDEAPDGILVMAGRDIVKGAALSTPSVLDITPTLLALAGIPVGEDMDGRVLREAISNAYLRAHPVETISTGWARR